MKKNTRRSVIRETLSFIQEVTRLFPNQDPIRLTSGILDFKLPLNQTLAILRSLAPQFTGENADMIRLAHGFNQLRKQISKNRKRALKRQVRKSRRDFIISA